jgi:hypothetical protein
VWTGGVRVGIGAMRGAWAFLSSALIVGCGGSIAPASESSDAGAEPDTGGRPVIEHVEPSSGPNSGGTPVRVSGWGFAVDGGTAFTFGSAPASSVTCTSGSICTMVSPAAGFTSLAQIVDLKATNNGQLGQEGSLTSATTGGDVFTYTGGPNCNSAQICGGFAEPDLVVTCPGAVTFFYATKTSTSTLGAGTSSTVPMQCGWVAACYGSPSDGSCTTYPLDAPASACGDPKFCKKCTAAGGFCTGGAEPLCCNGATCTDTEIPACP